SGKLRSLLWHRTLVGFAVNPKWPFGDLHDRYSCPQITGGLRRGGNDQNGQCVWLAAAVNQSRPLTDVVADFYGAEYERVIRAAVIDIMARYPGQTALTFLYYKPRRMLDSTLKSLSPWPQTPGIVAALAPAQGALLIAILVIASLRNTDAKIAGGRTI